jgi:hypothetical protein
MLPAAKVVLQLNITGYRHHQLAKQSLQAATGPETQQNS